MSSQSTTGPLASTIIGTLECDLVEVDVNFWCHGNDHKNYCLITRVRRRMALGLLCMRRKKLQRVAKDVLLASGDHTRMDALSLPHVLLFYTSLVK